MKKRFPRFSLRTLIIAVLAIALCWTLTATWGISNVLAKIAANRPEFERHIVGNELHLRLVGLSINEIVEDWNSEWIAHATPIAPFLVRVKFRKMKDNLEFRVDGDDTTYFWFFGYQKVVKSNAQVTLTVK